MAEENPKARATSHGGYDDPVFVVFLILILLLLGFNH